MGTRRKWQPVFKGIKPKYGVNLPAHPRVPGPQEKVAFYDPTQEVTSPLQGKFPDPFDAGNFVIPDTFTRNSTTKEWVLLKDDIKSLSPGVPLTESCLDFLLHFLVHGENDEWGYQGYTCRQAAVLPLRFLDKLLHMGSTDLSKRGFDIANAAGFFWPNIYPKTPLQYDCVFIPARHHPCTEKSPSMYLVCMFPRKKVIEVFDMKGSKNKRYCAYEYKSVLRAVFAWMNHQERMAMVHDRGLPRPESAKIDPKEWELFFGRPGLPIDDALYDKGIYIMYMATQILYGWDPAIGSHPSVTTHLRAKYFRKMCGRGCELQGDDTVPMKKPGCPKRRTKPTEGARFEYKSCALANMETRKVRQFASHIWASLAEAPRGETSLVAAKRHVVGNVSEGGFDDDVSSISHGCPEEGSTSTSDTCHDGESECPKEGATCTIGTSDTCHDGESECPKEGATCTVGTCPTEACTIGPNKPRPDNTRRVIKRYRTHDEQRKECLERRAKRIKETSATTRDENHTEDELEVKELQWVPADECSVLEGGAASSSVNEGYWKGRETTQSGDTMVTMLSPDWVKWAFKRGFCRRVQALKNSWVSVPLGNNLQDTTFPPEDLMTSVPVAHRQQPNERQCLFYSFASTLHYLGLQKEAHVFFIQARKYNERPRKEMLHGLRELAKKVIPSIGICTVSNRRNASGKVSRKYSVDEFVEEVSIYPTIIIPEGADGSISHACTVVDDLIFEASLNRAMRLSSRSLDWICSGGRQGGCKRLKEIFRFERPYGKAAAYKREVVTHLNTV